MYAAGFKRTLGYEHNFLICKLMFTLAIIPKKKLKFKLKTLNEILIKNK